VSATKTRALGVDALDGLVPLHTVQGLDPNQGMPEAPEAMDTPTPQAPLHATTPQPSFRRPRQTRAAASVPMEREKITFALPQDLVEACRDAADFLSGPPVRMTLAALVERALRREVERLRREHHHGEDFPPRGGPLRTGRPMRR
jgi:hypothetical protein